MFPLSARQLPLDFFYWCALIVESNVFLDDVRTIVAQSIGFAPHK